jgi:hypothetical protein
MVVLDLVIVAAACLYFFHGRSSLQESRLSHSSDIEIPHTSLPMPQQ